MNIRRHLRDEPHGHSSALNDILFILLLFFLIISTLANPNVVKLSIPKAKSDTKAKQTVVVSINDKQQFFVGTTGVGVDSLKQYISGALAKSQDAEPTVVINADKLATADNIVAVMRAAHDLNLRTVLAVDNNSR
ncbi:biopolymer transporter ExbD [Flavipsychrobacter stenotrophus]|uniref:Biopolymer transporter ExbD n=1 Tax=Flavipsychrobacter stenotrophus TaxID=2077091 RepID=A0A2S7SR35_9BACT|nr:biopolymer transporter ExbD [Flavipsychrobacter stenotrophus]PQJ09077.1 biopolymer transporter ExbD [Flavipsychrobacter stenotrophus]